ncbi:MAG: hypothetical protein NT116_05140, partial [Candidatus Parcubacteria bacterium]|nr:hypothetical protein [Candidatus Parcubacteria bacterium]
VAKERCYVDLPFIITDALLAKTKEQAPDWNKSDHQIAQTIANAVPTAKIKKALLGLQEQNAQTTVDWETTISLTFPKSTRAHIPIVVSVGREHVEVHLNYGKPEIKKTIVGNA